MGFVPIAFFEEKVGTILGEQAAIHVPIMSYFSAIIACYASIPICLPFPRVTNPTPVFFAFSAAISIA